MGKTAKWIGKNRTLKKKNPIFYAKNFPNHIFYECKFSASSKIQFTLFSLYAEFAYFLGRKIVVNRHVAVRAEIWWHKLEVLLVCKLSLGNKSVFTETPFTWTSGYCLSLLSQKSYSDKNCKLPSLHAKGSREPKTPAPLHFSCGDLFFKIPSHRVTTMNNEPTFINDRIILEIWPIFRLNFRSQNEAWLKSRNVCVQIIYA